MAREGAPPIFFYLRRCINYDTSVSMIVKRITAAFFATEGGTEPVRDWLRAMSREDRKKIGDDVKAVEFGWPIGMPVCRPWQRAL